MEEKMNNNEKLHPEDDEEQKLSCNTCIMACEKCGRRVLMFGRAIHDYEYHSGTICGDVDANVVSRMKEVACSVVIVLSRDASMFFVWKDTNERARYIPCYL